MMNSEVLVPQFASYLESNGRATKTIYGYKSDLRRFRRFYERRYNMEWYPEDTTTNDIEAFLQMLYVKEGLQAPSRNRILYCLRSFFTYTFGRGICSTNPTVSVKNVRYRRRKRAHLTIEEYEALLACIDDPLIKVVTQTLWHTGLRISELINLSVKDVDLTYHYIHVVGIEDADRDVPMNRTLYQFLSEYRETLPTVLDPYELFFKLETSGHLSASTYNRKLKIVVEEFGWEKKVTAHTFRHSFSSYLENRGVSPVVIQALLGHAHIDTTLIYTHAEPQKLAEAVDLLARSPEKDVSNGPAEV